MKNRLQLNQIKHHYGKRQLFAEFNLECETGDVVAIFGRNGSGKSTLLEALFGTLKPDLIDVMINGEPYSPTTKSKQIAYLPQQSFLPKDLKVRDVIPLYFEDEEKQNKIFHAPLIAPIDAQRIGTLSLGELRYLEFLLIVNLPNPFILLDEPFSMIQPLHKEAIKEIIQTTKKEKGFIITDHYYKDVFEIANKKLVLKEGNSIPVITENDLKEHGYLRQ
ncbi:MAG: ABC transporter ATP-binding protein [Bacteroidetes bacterium]|nr:ABC transporter ATP-binding protein [Bacteroidota bacterium]